MSCRAARAERGCAERMASSVASESVKPRRRTSTARSPFILTTRGARSGKLRKVALMRIERGGVYAVGAAETGDREVPLVLLEPATT